MLKKKFCERGKEKEKDKEKGRKKERKKEKKKERKEKQNILQQFILFLTYTCRIQKKIIIIKYRVH